jgi:hypothetical protein
MTTPPASHGISPKPMWAATSRLNGQPNPDANLWIQDSDRHDRDIAVLVTGQQSNMKIKGWIPVAIAKKPRYRNTSQNNWSVPQFNLQPIETLLRSSYAEVLK